MKRLSDKERGAAALEVAGLIPVILFCAVVALQMGLAAWTHISAGQAAHAAARAAAMGQSGHAAARSALPGSLKPESITSNGGFDTESWTVAVKIPSVLPGKSDMGTARQTRVMPHIR